MLIDKLKVCLAVSLLLLGLYGASYAINTTFAGEDAPRDSNSIQTAVSDSNTTDMAAVEDVTLGQNDGLSKDNTLAGQPVVQNDSNLAAERVVDQNAAQEKLPKTSGLDQKEQSRSRWMKGNMIAFYIAVGLAVASIVAWFLLRRTLRTRLRMKAIMINDPDIDDFLIIFDWTSKVLYFPTMIA